MTPNPKSSPRGRRVKAYAVFPTHSEHMLGMFMGLLAIFDKEERARAAIKFDDRLSRIAGKKHQNLTIVPVTISYTLPAKKVTKRV